MSRTALAFAAALAVGCTARSAVAEQRPAASGAAPEMSFHFERPGLPVPEYQLVLRQDGTGSYEGLEMPAVSERATAAADTAARPGEPFRQPVLVSPATVRRMFTLAQSLKQFNTTCASKAKNVADTGTKTLTYRGPEGAGSCTYNYSENKGVVQLTDLFFGIAETMDEGRRLDHLQRYDRLGLDSAIGFLAQEVTDGRALELGAIAPTLRSIAGDSELMQRVRLRASKLLSLLPADLQIKAP